MRLKVRQLVDMANISSLSIDKKRLRPGESLRLDVGILPFEQKETIQSFRLPIPKACDSGGAELLVFGADSYQMWEHMRAKGKFEPKSFGDVADMLSEAPSHRQLIVVLARRSRTRMLGREVLRQLPGSADAILSSGTTVGTQSEARFEVLEKWVFDTDFNLNGQQKLTVNIKPRKY